MPTTTSLLFTLLLCGRCLRTIKTQADSGGREDERVQITCRTPYRAQDRAWFYHSSYHWFCARCNTGGRTRRRRLRCLTPDGSGPRLLRCCHLRFMLPTTTTCSPGGELRAPRCGTGVQASLGSGSWAFLRCRAPTCHHLPDRMPHMACGMYTGFAHLPPFPSPSDSCACLLLTDAALPAVASLTVCCMATFAIRRHPSLWRATTANRMVLPMAGRSCVILSDLPAAWHFALLPPLCHNHYLYRFTTKYRPRCAARHRHLMTNSHCSLLISLNARRTSGRARTTAICSSAYTL